MVCMSAGFTPKGITFHDNYYSMNPEGCQAGEWPYARKKTAGSRAAPQIAPVASSRHLCYNTHIIFTKRGNAMISENLLEKYARLIVRTGANVQKGQVVMLTISVELSEFAALLIEECYKAGAKKVNVEWQSDAQKRLNFTYADEEVLCEVLPWEEAKLRQMTQDLPCRIFIASDDPDAMAGIDPGKLSAYVGFAQQLPDAVYQVYRRFKKHPAKRDP